MNDERESNFQFYFAIFMLIVVCIFGYLLINRFEQKEISNINDYQQINVWYNTIPSMKSIIEEKLEDGIITNKECSQLFEISRKEELKIEKEKLKSITEK